MVKLRLPMATATSLLRAYGLAVKAVMNTHSTESSIGAGFIIPDGQPSGKRKGLQIWVTASKFDEALLDSEPITGGLLVMRDRIAKAKRERSCG